MKDISAIRRGLNNIEGASIDLPPEPSYRGNEPGVQTTQIWLGENSNWVEEDPNFPISRRDPYDEREWGSEDEPDPGGFISELDPVFEISADVDETIPLLGGKEGEKIRKAVELHGMDALGWYVSFHVTGVQWGIYIPVSGMAHLIDRVFSGLPATLPTKMNLAFHAIFNHELFHFATDYAVAQAELAHEEPWWVPAKKAFIGEKPGYCAIEEELANAHMLRRFRSMKPSLRLRGKQKPLREFTKAQPEGYRDGWRIRAQDWDERLAALAKEYGKHSTKGAKNRQLWDLNSGFDWAGSFPTRPKIDWRYCPIHLVNDGARLSIPTPFLNFFSRIPSVQESEKFLKRLRDLADSVQRAWERTKCKLGMAITSGSDFKQWPNGGAGVYSVRINSNYRAHLQRPSSGVTWVALDIGTHKEMGHG